MDKNTKPAKTAVSRYDTYTADHDEIRELQEDGWEIVDRGAYGATMRRAITNPNRP